MRIDIIRGLDSVRFNKVHRSSFSWIRMTLMTLTLLLFPWICKLKLMISRLLDSKKLKRKRSRSARKRKPERQRKKKLNKRRRERKRRKRRRRLRRLPRRERLRWIKRKKRREKRERKKYKISWRWKPSKFLMILKLWKHIHSPLLNQLRITNLRCQCIMTLLFHQVLQVTLNRLRKKDTMLRNKKKKILWAVSLINSQRQKILNRLVCLLDFWILHRPRNLTINQLIINSFR